MISGSMSRDLELPSTEVGRMGIILGSALISSMAIVNALVMSLLLGSVIPLIATSVLLAVVLSFRMIEYLLPISAVTFIIDVIIVIHKLGVGVIL